MPARRIGFKLAVAIVPGVLLAAAAAAPAVLLLRGARPHRPDLEAWLDGEHLAYDSPSFLARRRPAPASG